MRLAGLVILSALAACGPHVERCGGPVLPIGCQAGGGGDGGLAGLVDRLDAGPDRTVVAAEPEHDDHYEGPDLDGGYEDEDAGPDHNERGREHDDDEREEEDEHGGKSERHRGSGRGAAEESGERGDDAMGRS